MNYYNENDPKCVAWLHELMRTGEIPPGTVDSRSIVDVKPHELTGYTQQHFFAGVGGWSLALKLAGWPEDKPVRTGSCPCQPFSQSGKQQGTKDKRHLWPHLRDLITFGEPTVTFGEQVASPLGREWLAGVRADLEGLGYEVGGADLCAACVGSPHIRQRLYWVAQPMHAKRRKVNEHKQNGCDGKNNRWEETHCDPGTRSKILRRRTNGLVQSNGTGWEARKFSGATTGYGGSIESTGSSSGVGDSKTTRPQKRQESKGRNSMGPEGSPIVEAGAVVGAWDNFTIVHCSDGKSRRFEPGSFPLAHGISHRVGLLRGYGNAIVPQLAAEFIKAYLETQT